SAVAIYGINSWRREAKWKRKYELAEEALALFYEVQDAISTIRSPLGHTSEGKTRKRRENESERDSEILDRAYVVRERFEKNKDPFFKLKALKYRFVALFGKGAEVYFNDIIKLTNKIIAVSDILGRYWKDEGKRKYTAEQQQRNIKQTEDYESIIWENWGNSEDEIKKELERIIEGIEKVCNAVLIKQ
ncbi:MAG: hypothetical protein AAFO07_32150, partial [Bacteroidota bacterium]